MTIQLWVVQKYQVTALADTLTCSSLHSNIGYSHKIVPLTHMGAMWGSAGTVLFGNSVGKWLDLVPTSDFDEVVKRMPEALDYISAVLDSRIHREYSDEMENEAEEVGFIAGWSNQKKCMAGYKYTVKDGDVSFFESSTFTNPLIPDATLLLPIPTSKLEKSLTTLAENTALAANSNSTSPLCGGSKTLATMTR